MLLSWLGFERSAVLRKAGGLDERQARVTPGGLQSIIGIVNHLSFVEWRWIDGCYLNEPVSRSEEEFHVPDGILLSEVALRYRERGVRTDQIVRTAPGLDAPCSHPDYPELDLRWVLVHLIEETARHAGHADATREMIDGTRGL